MTIFLLLCTFRVWTLQNLSLRDAQQRKGHRKISTTSLTSSASASASNDHSSAQDDRWCFHRPRICSLFPFLPDSHLYSSFFHLPYPYFLLIKEHLHSSTLPVSVCWPAQGFTISIQYTFLFVAGRTAKKTMIFESSSKIMLLGIGLILCSNNSSNKNM